MSTLAERIVRALEAEVGVSEEPPGSNRGERVQTYQASTYLPGSGWAWCGALVSFAWQAAGIEREVAWRYASPSVALMCERARADGLTCPPRIGACIAWCGVHVETLVADLGGGVWRTIGGNTGDAVRYRTRAITPDVVVFGAPGLDEWVPAPTETLYWLEDVGAEYRVRGPWREKAWAEAVWRGLEADTRRRAKVVATGNGGFAVRIGEPRHYGPWIGEAGMRARDGVRAGLENRLGRRLRPYRTERLPKGAPEAAVEALGKTT